MNPWEEFPGIWPTKAKFMAWLRGGIRRACWNRSPIKHTVIKNQRKRVKNEKTGNMVWGGECYICKNDFLMKDLQVDHIQGEHSLREIEDIQAFVEAMTCLSLDDLALVCKPCHKVKSLAERSGMSFDEALIHKEVISFSKLTAERQKGILLELGYSKEDVATVAKRKNAYKRHLEEEL